VKPEKAGTFAGLIEKIPYLADLGITAVELMPTFQFDATDAPAGRVNFWGYSPVSFVLQKLLTSEPTTGFIAIELFAHES
jgi:isoamylase